MGDLTFGYHLPRFRKYRDPAAWRDLATATEAAGFDVVWRDDHVSIPDSIETDGYQFGTPDWAGGEAPYCDVFGVLSHVAAVTDRVAVGTNVCVVPYRHPVVLAKQALTLATLAGERFEFGVGAGWLEAEFDLLDVPFDERGSRTDEFLELFGRACDGGTVGFDGPHHQFPPTSFHPLPDEPPRLWVGGHSRAAYERVARFGDGWTIVRKPPDVVDTARAAIERAWDEAGRGGRPDIAVRHGVRFDHGDRPTTEDGTTVGSVDDVIDVVGAYREAGATLFTMRGAAPDRERELADIEQFGDAVIPAFS